MRRGGRSGGLPPGPRRARWPRQGMDKAPPPSPHEEATRLAAERTRARAAGDYQRADALREQIRDLGWEVMDGAHGTSLRPSLPARDDASVAYARPEDLASLLDEAAGLQSSVVVVAEDHPADIDRLLRGLGDHPPLASWELIVVANRPSFDPGQSLAMHDLEVEPSLLATSERLGWADAVNLGLRRARGEVVLLLDASVEPTGDLVTPLVEAFADPTVGIAGAFGVNSADLRQFDEASPGEVDAIE